MKRPQCQYNEARVHASWVCRVLISLIPEIRSMFDDGLNFLNCVCGFFTKSNFFFQVSRVSRSRCWSAFKVTPTWSTCVSNSFDNSEAEGGFAKVETVKGLRLFCSIKPLERNSSQSLTNHHSFAAALRGEAVV